jgi:hypothetical protein
MHRASSVFLLACVTERSGVCELSLPVIRCIGARGCCLSTSSPPSWPGDWEPPWSFRHIPAQSSGARQTNVEPPVDPRCPSPIVFGDHLGIKARCIGHGAIPGTVPYGNPSFPQIPVTRIDERPAAGTNHITHGFALLTFDGPNLSVTYIDEFGVTWFQEQL